MWQEDYSLEKKYATIKGETIMGGLINNGSSFLSFPQYPKAIAGAWGISPPKVVRVIHNSPATIVFWKDGTKTVVKAQGENYDAEKGIAMAFMKKVYGNKGRYFNDVKKWVK